MSAIVRGRPFKKKGDEWSDEARVGSASDQTRDSGELDETAPQQDFAAFAQALLTNPAVRKAFVKRWKRADISGAELKMIVDAAALAPPTSDRRDQVREELARLNRLNRGERKLLYILTKRMAGEPVESSIRGYTWRLVRTPGGVAGADLPRATITYERPDEPDLAETLPLAEASRRLRELPETTVIPTPEQALRALPEILQEVKTVAVVHDADDERHRAVCRGCRADWRARS